MTVPAARPLAPPPYRRLLELLDEEGKERILLREALDLLRGALGVGSIAAYLGEAASFELCVSVGPDAFPQSLDTALETPLTVHRFAGGLLVTPARFSLEELPEPLELLLAAALRLCRYRYRLKQHDFDARYRGVELEALHDVGLAIASTLDLGELTEEILLRAVSLLDARRGALYLLEGGAYRLRSAIGGAAREELVLASRDPSDGYGALPGANHLLVVPIEVEGQPRGLLAVGDKESRQGVGPFSEGDRRSLALLANQAALALEQARLHQEMVEKERMEREMDLASQIQRGILPRKLPPLAGYELLAWTRPARHVGGDYYDLLPLSGGRLALLVADVTGKGVPAALLVATLHSSVRLLVERCDGYEELMHCLNDHLLEFSSSNKFVTLFMAELDPARGLLRYVNAGHNAGLVLRRGGGVEELSATGIPLGLMARASYRQRETVLEEGDLLCVYSDGVTEAATPDEKELGIAALVDLLDQLREQPLDEVRSVVERTIRELAAGLPQGDDQTMLLLRRSRR